MRTTSIKTLTALFALTAFVFTVFAMPVSIMGMEHHQNVPMSNCPFMFGEEAICAMSVFEHISTWQTMMTAIPPEVVMLVLLVAYTAFCFLRRLFDPPDLSPPDTCAPFHFPHTSLFATILLGSTISPRAP